MGWMADETGLDKGPANHVALTPLSHLARAAAIWPDREALVYGTVRRSYSDYQARVSRLASALAARGVTPGDVVAPLLPNVPAQVEAGFGVPACGAVLNTINTRLDLETVQYILGHGGAKVLLVDSALIELAEEAAAVQKTPPLIIEVPDPVAGIEATGRHLTYEDLVAEGDPAFRWIMPEDEWESLALNYTSGTTGRPKGVVYHHRGAYLITFGTVVSWRMVLHPRLLTVVPLFHCNGWCHFWMMPLVGGTVVCLREVTAKGIFDAIADEGVTHFGGAPIVLNTLANAGDDERRPLPHVVEVYTAGAPPPAATLAKAEALGLNVTHCYGLTETYGHVVENVWQDKWDGSAPDERAALKARQGVAYPMMEGVGVFDADGSPVPLDGETQGEVGMRGNAVMKGYYRNPEATAEAFEGGWFRSGDIAVVHPDGYLQIKDRAKDIIISGGENVSSVEVEGVLMHHPAVDLCAVVAQPDEKWGEVPCAFVETRGEVTEEELIAFARERLAGFKTPKRVVFGELPKTSTGKIQKFELRNRAKDGA
ncbi:AMP-binding protein [Jannaschia aquimarina]|uniref:3-methylmercaptopropionyl-CoA ligase n=1 Tax=Jannaschia aquimarina TaxID=935700 RepID=A0A0D1CTN2_9RHOB|nr:AMP-binding protein [Jannaschia aquimarina]KIT18137.1 Long-chain-fatty-acid--CoA ligase [Jannaschia aquimarina]SNT30253.1 fatty-acyl-CoA synthase [Jannaschia aquimarina]